MKRWDLFICHASEDKDTIVRPLAAELARRGLRVWFDEHTLTLGDSLRAKIDEGLSQSRYGVVVLSAAFFAKDWPQRELDGLLAFEASGHKVVLPIWHEVTRDQVSARSPILAGRVAVRSSQGVTRVAQEILRAVTRSEPIPDEGSIPDRAELTTQQLHAAVFGVQLQRLSDLARLQTLAEHAGAYHWMRAQVLAGMTSMQLSTATEDIVTAFVTAKPARPAHEARVAIRDDISSVHGIRVMAAFESGYQLANISAYCSLLSAADKGTSEHAAVVTEALHDLEQVMGQTGLDSYPDLTRHDMAHWLSLLKAEPTDRATYALIEEGSYKAITALLERQDQPPRSYEAADAGS